MVFHSISNFVNQANEICQFLTIFPQEMDYKLNEHCINEDIILLKKQKEESIYQNKK